MKAIKYLKKKCKSDVTYHFRLTKNTLDNIYSLSKFANENPSHIIRCALNHFIDEINNTTNWKKINE